jgi:hypothetical protein
MVIELVIVWLTNLPRRNLRLPIPRSSACIRPVHRRGSMLRLSWGRAAAHKKPAERRYSNSAGFAVHSTRRTSEPASERVGLHSV